MVLWAVLACTLLISATVDARVGFSFWTDEVTLTCPESGDWFQGKASDAKSVSLQNGTKSYSYIYTGNKDMYHCRYQSTQTNEMETYHFYIQGKACGSCFELDAQVFAVVIVADLVATAVVIAIVYKCCKKTSAGPQKKSKGRSREADIPLDDRTSSPYQALSPHTRSQDPYQVINRTG